MGAIYIALCLLGVIYGVRSSGVAPLVMLNDGKMMPQLGLGTWLGFTKSGERVPVNDSSVQQAVQDAIDAGYRHIDTAAIYDTEVQVGRGVNNRIRSSVVKREDLFITTKLWNDQHARAAVVPALCESLWKLNLTYVDLYLIHWPVATFANGSLDNTIDYLETWAGMIEARNLGLTKSIGVSNFNQHMLDRVISLSNVTPAVLQVEINLNLQQPQLLEFCKQHNIVVVGYTPFGSLFPSKASTEAPPPRVNHWELIRIANKYRKTVPQLALRYLLDLGVVPIPKSITKERIQQNIQVFDFQLSDEEKQLFKSFDQAYRTIPVKNWIDSIYYPFEKDEKKNVTKNV